MKLHTPLSFHLNLLLVSSMAVLLNGCGSGTSSDPGHSGAAGDTATGVTTLHLVPPEISDEAAQQTMKPGFHVAPVILDEPANEDAVDNAASSRRMPTMHAVPVEFQNLSTKRLTLQKMQLARQGQTSEADGSVNPMSSSSSVITYTPAQIRAAYGLPVLPANGTTLSAAQAAALGAGQTIYLIDAMNDPNVAAELAAFNQKFGLPACTATAISSTARLPLAAASTGGCQFSVVYNTTSGGMTSAAPVYDSGWATEIALDVQWSHATSPLARIILIEAADASTNSLVGAIALANAMGPGAVSMSFGTPEGSWTASEDAAFTAVNMSYLAATGDAGAGVQWPAVSTHVLAVGGTSLTYSGSGSRSEVAWADSGGGISAYIARPSYQSSSVPDMGSQSTRAVADVSFNANPNTGQYLAVMTPGSSSVSWLSAGGTSLSTPQWAGVLAIANAERALSSKAALGAPHAALYGQVASVPGSYSSGFLDVTEGADGSCATCTAHVGYDQVTGLGTPNVSGLLNLLTGAINNPPVVTPASVSGVVGTALTFTVSVGAPDAVTYALSGQPAGMTISSSGAVAWPSPVLGTYHVTATAKDSKTGLSGSGLYTITITTPPAPVVNAQSISGKVDVALSFAVSTTAQDPLAYSLAHQPTGMTISTQGVVSWPKPVAGSYSVTVTAKDSKTGLSGSATVNITIANAPPPAVSGEQISGTTGTALSFTVTVNAANAVSISLSNAPSGMSINNAGLVTWANPVTGNYSVTVTAKDDVTGLTGTGVISIIIAANGLTVTAPAMVGQVGKALTGTIAISDPNAAWLDASISGVPMGMVFSFNGLTITAIWPNPVRGSYAMKVLVTDSSGRSRQVSIPITVNAS